MRKSVFHCFEAFQRLLFGFFSSQQHGCRFLSWPRQIIRGVTNRGLYDTNQVESLLRTHYSCTRRLFGPDVPTSTKIAVTTTTQHGPVILTNYKPAVHRPETAGNSPSFSSLRKIGVSLLHSSLPLRWIPAHLNPSDNPFTLVFICTTITRIQSTNHKHPCRLS